MAASRPPRKPSTAPAKGSTSRSSPVTPVLAGLYGAVFLAALLVAGLFLSWQALAVLDFAYPVWHELLGIGETIARHGPENRFREGFERTTPFERARLFAGIVDAIHDGGRGLADLRYHGPDGEVLGRLLRPPEIVHLRDVARLVGWFELAGLVAIALIVVLTGEACWHRRSLPPVRRVAVGGAGLLVVAVAAVFVAGPVDVFYGLHEVVFPGDHQWFFWYEESLMSTMMQAPDLFGAIAALWFPLALALAGAGQWGIARLLTVRHRGSA